LPVLVGLDLVHEHGALLAAVTAQVTLAVAVEVQPPGLERAVDGPLPHRGVHGAALPGHVARQAHVHREQAPCLPLHDHPPGEPSGDHSLSRPGGPGLAGTRPASYAMMTSCTRSLAPSLASSRATCVLAVPAVMYRAAAISAFDRPRPTCLSTSRSRSV